MSSCELEPRWAHLELLQPLVAEGVDRSVRTQLQQPLEVSREGLEARRPREDGGRLRRGEERPPLGRARLGHGRRLLPHRHHAALQLEAQPGLAGPRRCHKRPATHVSRVLRGLDRPAGTRRFALRRHPVLFPKGYRLAKLQAHLRQLAIVHGALLLLHTSSARQPAPENCLTFRHLLALVSASLRRIVARFDRVVSDNTCKVARRIVAGAAHTAQRTRAVTGHGTAHSPAVAKVHIEGGPLKRRAGHMAGHFVALTSACGAALRSPTSLGRRFPSQSPNLQNKE